MKPAFVGFCLSLAVAGLAHAADEAPAAVGGKTYARHLATEARLAHPGALGVAILVDGAKGAPPVLVGASPAHPGAGVVVHELLRNVSGDALGVIDITFAPGTNNRSGVARAIGAYVGHRVLSAKNLADPYPYDPARRADTQAQALVDQTLKAHPELLVFAIHATPPEGGANIIIGSNIGRIGKKADDDDLRVIEKGATNLEVAEGGERFEVELPLNDAGGQRIGALGTVFAYKAGDDKKALEARAIAIRDDLARRTPSSAALFKTASPAPLTLGGSTDLPGYTGDFDHFAIDQAHGQLFLAGEEHHELDIFDLATGALKQRLGGYGAPHSPLVMAARGEVLVVDGEKPSHVLDTATLKTKRSYALPAGADSIAYDASARRVWIVTGGKDVPQPDSNLIEVDPATGKTLKSIHFDADHVEALAVEQAGPRLFINVTDKNTLAVIDKASGRIEHTWKIREAEQNAPLAMDEKTHRLFVVTRKPGMLVVLNADTGATVASFKAPERTDQVTWDPVNRRVYVTGGEGYISVVQQSGADHYAEIARVPSLPGAKTAILDGVSHRLWVAASPGDSGAVGKVMWYEVSPTS